MRPSNPRRRPSLDCLLLAAAGVAATARSAEARVTRVEIAPVQSPTFEGASFGPVGPYEKLSGRVYGEVDPADPLNAVTADIGLAPRNARGMVEYSSAVTIFRPVDRAKGNHRLLFELTNRGNELSFGALNDAARNNNDPATAADAGNGFMMRRGYTGVLSGRGAGSPGAPGGGSLPPPGPGATQPHRSPL